MSQMLNGEMARIVKDDQGAIMIDRSPKYFEPILNYLRTGEFLIDSDVNKEAVLAEAKYFGIQSLVDQYEKNDVTWPPIDFEAYQDLMEDDGAVDGNTIPEVSTESKQYLFTLKKLNEPLTNISDDIVPSLNGNALVPSLIVLISSLFCASFIMVVCYNLYQMCCNL